MIFFTIATIGIIGINLMMTLQNYKFLERNKILIEESRIANTKIFNLIDSVKPKEWTEKDVLKNLSIYAEWKNLVSLPVGKLPDQKFSFNSERRKIKELILDIDEELALLEDLTEEIMWSSGMNLFISSTLLFLFPTMLPATLSTLSPIMSRLLISLSKSTLKPVLMSDSDRIKLYEELCKNLENTCPEAMKILKENELTNVFTPLNLGLKKNLSTLQSGQSTPTDSSLDISPKISETDIDIF